MLGPVADFVRHHDEPVRRSEFRLFAVAVLTVAVGIVSASTYAYLNDAHRICAASVTACEPWIQPGTAGQLRAPASRDTMPARLGAEKPSGRRG
jgi:hypothetical protein